MPACFGYYLSIFFSRPYIFSKVQPPYHIGACFREGKNPRAKKRNSITSPGLSDSLKNEKGEAGAIFTEGRERRIKRGN